MVHADGVGRTFDSARGYRERVGRLLFGLPLDEYDELLLLLDRLANLRWASKSPPSCARLWPARIPSAWLSGWLSPLLRPSLTTDLAVRPRAGWRAAGRVACTP